MNQIFPDQSHHFWRLCREIKIFIFAWILAKGVRVAYGFGGSTESECSVYSWKFKGGIFICPNSNNVRWPNLT